MFLCRDGISQMMSRAWCLPDIVLGVLPKEFNVCLIRPDNLFPHALVLRMMFGKLHIHFTQEWLPSSHSTIKAWFMECCWDLHLHFFSIFGNLWCLPVRSLTCCVQCYFALNYYSQSELSLMLTQQLPTPALLRQPLHVLVILLLLCHFGRF